MPKVGLSTNIAIEHPLTARDFLIQRTNTYDATTGKNTVSSQETITARGDIQPFTGVAYDRQSGNVITAEKIVIHTKTFITPGYEYIDPLTQGKIRFDADRILWNDKQYRVFEVSDWSDYGQGFYEVLAALTTFRGKRP